MMSKIDKVRRQVNDAFRDKLKASFKVTFGREIETEFSILSMMPVSRPADGKKFTKQQHAFVKAYSDGYGEAMEQITELAK